MDDRTISMQRDSTCAGYSKRSVSCSPFVIAVLALFAIYCAQDSSNPEELIVGSWEWVYTKSLWDPSKIKTPSSVGVTVTKNFMDDGRLRVFENNSLNSTYNYNVNYTYISEPEVRGTLFIDGIESSFITVTADTLHFGPIETDGSNSWYVRME